MPVSLAPAGEMRNVKCIEKKWKILQKKKKLKNSLETAERERLSTRAISTISRWGKFSSASCVIALNGTNSLFFHTIYTTFRVRLKMAKKKFVRKHSPTTEPIFKIIHAKGFTWSQFLHQRFAWITLEREGLCWMLANEAHLILRGFFPLRWMQALVWRCEISLFFSLARLVSVYLCFHGIDLCWQSELCAVLKS